MADLQHWLISVLLVSLRLIPGLAFSPPFTLVPIPATARLILSLSLSAWLVSGHPAQTTGVDFSATGYFAVISSELIIGIALALALQLAFAALMTVGRTIDLQAGYAFAMIADPASASQVPLIGMLFAYAAGVVFFTTSAPSDLLGIWSLSLDHLPLGAALGNHALTILSAYIGAIFLMAFGAGGLVLVVLFLLDATIALMSRTLPQMNVLFLGFQVKTIATLVVLPVAIGGSAAVYLRMFRFALETMTRMA